MSSILTVPYTQVQQYTVEIGRQRLLHVTKPGLPSWSVVAPSSQLFIENAVINSANRVLLFGCHLGAVAAYLVRANPALELYITDHNHTALEMTRLALQANQVTSVRILASIELDKSLYGAFDVIYIQLPKGRQLIRRWLVQAFLGLADGGQLYLAGANEAGIHSAMKDAEGLFGNGQVLAYKKGNRIGWFSKSKGDHPEPAWGHSPGVSPGSWVEFPVTFSSRVFPIRSLPGVFSFDHLDEGTHILLDAVRISAGSSVVDVGCGYGVIGLAAAVAGAATVHLVDNDLLATAACAETLALNGIAQAQVFTGDLLAPVSGYQYDLVLSNPPFHSGQAVNYQMAQAMIGQSYQVLKPGGELVIVANRFIRYEQLIESTFGNVTILAESRKFQVLSGLKSGVRN